MAIKTRYKDLRAGDLVLSPDEGLRIIEWVLLSMNSPEMTFSFVGDKQVHKLNGDNLCRLEKRFSWRPEAFVLSENWCESSKVLGVYETLQLAQDAVPEAHWEFDGDDDWNGHIQLSFQSGHIATVSPEKTYEEVDFVIKKVFLNAPRERCFQEDWTHGAHWANSIASAKAYLGLEEFSIFGEDA